VKLIRTGKIKTRLIWFDSLGAKSSSVLIETPDLKLLIDPGASGMQPSYPHGDAPALAREIRMRMGIPAEPMP
jgi:predicted metallo-beta-lactamase superfamily hydrolase